MGQVGGHRAECDALLSQIQGALDHLAHLETQVSGLATYRGILVNQTEMRLYLLFFD